VRKLCDCRCGRVHYARRRKESKADMVPPTHVLECTHTTAENGRTLFFIFFLCHVIPFPWHKKKFSRKDVCTTQQANVEVFLNCNVVGCAAFWQKLGLYLQHQGPNIYAERNLSMQLLHLLPDFNAGSP
jgi:hypothetical protein